MRGNPDSCGVWAPCLSHADGLLLADLHRRQALDGNFKDAHNYLVTAPAITGPWSDPIYLNSSGFDPSLFHDDDGRKWFVNQQWKHIDRQRRRPPARHRLRRHPLPGIRPGRPPPHRPDPQHLRRLPARPRRGPAPLQARRLVLPHHRRGRHRLRPRRHHGPLPRPPRPLRAAPGHPPAHLEGRPRRRPAARRPRPDRRDPRRPDLPHPPLLAARSPAPAARRSAARPRSRSASGRRRLALPRARRPRPRPRRPRPAGAPEPEPDRPVEYRFDGPQLPQDFQWLRTPYPERLFTLTGDAAAPARPRVDRQLVRAGARRPPPAASPLPRRDPPRRLRPRHLPAGRRPHDLLQPLQVPLPRRQPRRRHSAAS